MAVRPRWRTVVKGQAVVSCAILIAMALAAFVLCAEQVQAIHVRDSQSVASVEEEPLAEDAAEAVAATSAGEDLPTSAAAAGPEAISIDATNSTAGIEAEAENLAGERAAQAQAAAANEKMAEELADQEAEQAGNIAAQGVTKESAANSCTLDKVGAEYMHICEACAAILTGESVYHNAVQTMEGSRDVSTEHETETLLRDMLTQIDDSMAMLTTLEDISPDVAAEDPALAGHAEDTEAEATSAIDKMLSMLDSAFPMILKVKEGRDLWRKTTSAAVDAQKLFEATVDRLERIKAEAKRAKELELAKVLNETIVVHARLVSQLETARNMSVAAKNAFARDSSTPDNVDTLMQLSRQATTAAVATDQYYKKLKHGAEQLRSELSSMGGQDGPKSGSPSPAPDSDQASDNSAADDSELMALKQKSEVAMEKFTEMVEGAGDAGVGKEEATNTIPGPTHASSN